MWKPNFNIQIVTQADLKGAAQAEAAIHKVKSATDQASKGMQDAGAKGSRAFEGLNKSGNVFQKTTRGLASGIRGLALQFPILGRFAEAVVNPLMLGFGAMIFVVARLVQHFKLLSQNFKNFQSEELKTALENQKKALEDASLAADEYSRKLVQIRLDGLGAVESTNDMISAIQRQARMADELASDELALELAQIDEQERSGQISGTTAIKQRAAARDRFEKAKLVRQKQVEDETLKAKETEFDQAKIRIRENQRLLEDNQRAQGGLKTPEVVDAEIASQQEKVKQIRAQMIAASSAPRGFGGGYVDPAAKFRQQLKEQQSTLDALQSNREREINRYREAQEYGNRLQNSVSTDEELVSGLMKALPRMAEEFDAAQANRAKRYEIQSKTRQLTTKGEIAQTGVNDADSKNQAAAIYAAGQKNFRTASDLEATAREVATNDIQESTAVLEGILEVLNSMNQQKVSYADFMDRIKQIENQIRYQRSQP